MFKRDSWSISDIKELEDYLYSIRNDEKIEWTRNIINTKLPVLAIKLGVLKGIAKEMKKGEFLTFLDIMPVSSFEILIICGFLINEIKDFDIQKKYIKKYALKCDSWSYCDTLKFRIKGREEDYLKLSKELIKSKKPFVRRVGIDVLFALLKTDKYLDDIYDILDSFYDEEEYYVNMALAWLLCVLVVKHRDRTIKYLDNNHLNQSVINKGVQKCRDSFRVSAEDKEMLLKYKK